jgi:hypothetical protein
MSRDTPKSIPIKRWLLPDVVGLQITPFEQDAFEFAQVGSPPLTPNKPVAISIHEKPVTRASEFPRAERPIESWEIGRATC